MPKKLAAVVAVTALMLAAAPLGLGADAPKDEGKCFMWKATRGESVVYLYGTIHMAKTSIYPLDPAIEAAYAESEAIVMEMSLSAATMTKSALLAMQKGMYTGEENLTDKLSNETLLELRQYFKSVNAPVGTFEATLRMKPWLASMNLAAFEYARLGYVAASGVDMHFYRKAEAEGKRILELETPEFQISMLADVSEEEQILLLEKALADMPKTREFIENLTAAWLVGDVETAEKIFLDTLSDDPRLKKAEDGLITDRNKTMFEKIEKLLENGKTYFVMVGSAHLMGEEGIVELLRAEGYDVEQLDRAPAVEKVEEVVEAI
jgi:uncharacterized protein YbaP (TraB family)